MADRNWTPGPWECDGAALEYEGARFGEVAYVLSKEGEQFPASSANAYLIAAAPDLYEACAAAEDYLATSDFEAAQSIYVQLHAALAKARGE